MSIKTYSKLLLLPTFQARYDYLKCRKPVGVVTFGGRRQLNQILYHLPEWRSFRRQVILRDNGLDLGLEGYPISGPIYIHHINPITVEDVMKRKPCVFDMENAISCSFRTHQAIHYESECPVKEYKERTKNDTCPWLS